DHAARVGSEAAAMGSGVLRALSDDDAQEVITALAREHLIVPEWSPAIGEWLGRIVDADAHRTAVDLAAENIDEWLANNRDAFTGLVSGRLPSWVPSIAARLVDETVYSEAVTFVRAVRTNPDHPARAAITAYLARLS
ncbi:MAG TPA: DUF445 domain-containing protein, partial [Microbacterium sp.]|nr:DUF445 domain-containing protein [Microbacterium sp.]